MAIGNNNRDYNYTCTTWRFTWSRSSWVIDGLGKPFEVICCCSCAQLSSRDWGLPQSRNRVYFVLVQSHLASEEKLNFVFKEVLQHRVLPAFQRFGKGTVPKARSYVEGVLDVLEWEPTLPSPSQDLPFFVFFRSWELLAHVIFFLMSWCQSSLFLLHFLGSCRPPVRGLSQGLGEFETV